MRKIFSKLQFLDGVELPRLPGFDIIDSSNMPPTLGSQYYSEEVKGFVETFIQQYYQVYENSNRRALAAAYTEDACFSMMSVAPEHGSTPWHNAKKVFQTNSRNLLREVNDAKRYANLFQGQQSIIDMLCRMPVSLHDPVSFVIDVPIAQAQLLHVCLRGLVTYVDGNNKILRSFSRSLIIVPVGSGFCISNEEFFVGTPSLQQKRGTKAIPPAVPSSSSATVTNTLIEGLSQIQISMIEQFSEHSKMHPQFSKECLERNNWDFDKAAQVFVTLKEENKLPTEYFVT